MADVQISEFKGNPVIVLRRSAEDRYPFQFGLSKAKLVVESIEEIKKFVEDQEKVKAAKEAAKEAAEGN